MYLSDIAAMPKRKWWGEPDDRILWVGYVACLEVNTSARKTGNSLQWFWELQCHV